MLHPLCDGQGAEQVFVPVPVHVHAIDHPGKLPFQDGDGRFQLVGGGGEKGRPLTFPLPFPLHLALQRFIGGCEIL